jgi:hypothetical protein
MPLMVTVFEVTGVLSGTSVWAVKVKASGVVSGGRVVTLKVLVAPPMVRTVLVVSLKAAELVWRTQTALPFET